jgi:trigger factor
VPAIDEEFVKNFDKYESIAALREDVRQGLVAEADRKAAAAFDRHIDDKLLAANDFEVPPSFVERQIFFMMSDAQRRLVANGMESKKAAEFSAKLHDQFKDEALRIVKVILLIKHIARKENLTVTDEELAARIQEIASQRGQDVATVRAGLEKDDLIDNLRSDLLTRKTYDYLVAKAQVTEVAAPQDAPVEG